MTGKATLFAIQQFSTDDGPGIRTTLFFKGCPLRCAWCHNPEGLSPHPQLMWHDARCTGARACLSICPERALELTPRGVYVDRNRCTACGQCADVCPTAALEVIGNDWNAQELRNELLKDRVFYETSGGGITLSGGEPMQQADWLGEFLPRLKAERLHIALDTCGLAAWDRYEGVLPYVDLVLFDLKIVDAARHQAATGVSNALILENARRLSARGVPLWIRTPVIPNYTADLENIRALAQFIREHLPRVERWDLLAYTNLGKPKYHRLDLPYALEETPLFTKAEMETVWQSAVEIVPVARWSGATR